MRVFLLLAAFAAFSLSALAKDPLDEADGKPKSDIIDQAGKIAKRDQKPVGSLFTDHLNEVVRHPRCTLCHGFFMGEGGPLGKGLLHISMKDDPKGHKERVKEAVPTDEALKESWDKSPDKRAEFDELSESFVEMLRRSYVVNKTNEQCAKCHTTGKWRAPHIDFGFISETPEEVCEMFRQLGETDLTKPSIIGEHLKTDPLILWAIADGSLPSGKRADPISDKETWFAQVDAWLKGGMRCR